MSDQEKPNNQNNFPLKMEFTINDITSGINYWLSKVILREEISVKEISWNSNKNTFIVTLKK
jgi:hypothetical protein